MTDLAALEAKAASGAVLERWERAKLAELRVAAKRAPAAPRRLYSAPPPPAMKATTAAKLAADIKKHIELGSTLTDAATGATRKAVSLSHLVNLLRDYSVVEGVSRWRNVSNLSASELTEMGFAILCSTANPNGGNRGWEPAEWVEDRGYRKTKIGTWHQWVALRA